MGPFLVPSSPALSCDADPGGRIALGPLAPGKCPSARCLAPGKLKLRPFLMPWSPALSCVSSSAQVGSLTLMRIDGEPGGKLALGPMDPGQWPSARCPPWCAEARDLPVVLVSYTELSELFNPGGAPWHSPA
ncbi:SNHG14 isoform 23 [Pan troglodytes]|uniref:SNHG14 isoform 23 n=1 Tax=Pan troglodytes TaxID=9598 RepID=A0A2J8KLE5_PANTR|nr:SNHG14 isoform 23 [Pan troglodytes]